MSERGVGIRDSEILSAVLEPAAPVAHDVAEGRAAYVIATDGPIDIDGTTVDAGERVVARGPGTLTVRAVARTEVVLVDSPA